ncbi:hypothetical protein ACQZ6B_16395 [Agrobacterium vitis]
MKGNILAEKNACKPASPKVRLNKNQACTRFNLMRLKRSIGDEILRKIEPEVEPKNDVPAMVDP